MLKYRQMVELLEQRINNGEFFDICYTLQENEFMGKSDIQMMIRDIKFKEE